MSRKKFIFGKSRGFLTKKISKDEAFKLCIVLFFATIIFVALISSLLKFIVPPLA